MTALQKQAEPTALTKRLQQIEKEKMALSQEIEKFRRLKADPLNNSTSSDADKIRLAEAFFDYLPALGNYIDSYKDLPAFENFKTPRSILGFQQPFLTRTQNLIRYVRQDGHTTSLVEPNVPVDHSLEFKKLLDKVEKIRARAGEPIDNAFDVLNMIRLFFPPQSTWTQYLYYFRKNLEQTVKSYQDQSSLYKTLLESNSINSLKDLDLAFYKILGEKDYKKVEQLSSVDRRLRQSQIQEDYVPSLQVALYNANTQLKAYTNQLNQKTDEIGKEGTSKSSRENTERLKTTAVEIAELREAIGRTNEKIQKIRAEMNQAQERYGASYHQIANRFTIEREEE
jgi:predicted  nucleic acid-binding Zn-ribbon protein